MQHYIYAVSKEETAPVGTGDEASWLRYYKLEADDSSVFVPMKKGLENIKQGDYLWFVVDQQVDGAVLVSRIEDGAGGVEIWFDGSAIRRPVDPGLSLFTGLKSGDVSEQIWKRWMKWLEGT